VLDRQYVRQDVLEMWAVIQQVHWSCHWIHRQSTVGYPCCVGCTWSGSKWLLTFCLTALLVHKIFSELKTVCAQKLDSVGLHICCVVCDQAATNISALMQLGFCEDVPQLTVEHIPHAGSLWSRSKRRQLISTHFLHLYNIHKITHTTMLHD